MRFYYAASARVSKIEGPRRGGGLREFAAFEAASPEVFRFLFIMPLILDVERLSAAPSIYRCYGVSGGEIAMPLHDY